MGNHNHTNMTLTKEKPRRPTADSRKRTGHHHHHGHHYLKTYWPYLPIIAIVSFGIAANGWLNSLHHTVLGYATDMSVASLLEDTNAQRTANGESALDINGQLDQAAQAKANDMSARDYWSHNTPDGSTPWSFISAAGYVYQTAGENLAYGFTSASDTMTAWMNSPEHRANILGATYKDVGFGIVNIPDYQNQGPETLVVAMYASPAPAAVAAATPVQKPTAVAPQPNPAPEANPAPSLPQTPAPDPAIATTKPAASTPAAKASVTAEPNQQSISRIQLVSSTAASWSALAVTVIGLSALAFIVIRHGYAWHKFLRRGEQFALHHPALDIASALVIAIVIVLGQTTGLIR